MTIKNIIQVIEKTAPRAYAEEWDNVGLLIGNEDDTVKGVLIALELTEAVLQEAINDGFNLIITHHPLIFSGIKKITPHDPTGRMIQRAIANNIAVYAAHTNLDNAPEGVNRMLAGKIGLEKTSILSPQQHQLLKLVTFVPVRHTQKVRDAIFAAGAGCIGDYDFCSFSVEGEGTFRAGGQAHPFVGEIGKLHVEKEHRIETVFPSYLRRQVVAALLAAHPYEEPAYDLYQLENTTGQTGSGVVGALPEPMDEKDFLQKLKQILNIPALRHSGFIGKPIRRVALCGGAGSFLIRSALEQNADVFITADLKYHDFFIPDKKMLLVDAGHFETEQFTTSLLLNILNQNFTNFAIRISGISTNAVNYLI